MTDLKSKPWIVAKGVMFLAIAAAALILLEALSLKMGVLLALLVWASCRFHYFLFYVLERYVDPTLRYAGILDLLLGMRRRTPDPTPRRAALAPSKNDSPAPNSMRVRSTT